MKFVVVDVRNSKFQCLGDVQTNPTRARTLVLSDSADSADDQCECDIVEASSQRDE